MLFGDAAGAAVLTASEGPYRLGRFWAMTYGDQYCHLVRGGGTSSATHENGGLKGHYLQMDGRRVFRAAVKGFCDAIEQTAILNDLAISDIDWIVPHQANVRIFAEVAARLQIPMDTFWNNIARYGNTVAASVPLALEEFHRQCGPIPGIKLLLACVGAGMTAGGTVLYVD
jgi:3-oxoacyl-[acyl-carrier-protein] synthase-3